MNAHDYLLYAYFRRTLKPPTSCILLAQLPPQVKHAVQAVQAVHMCWRTSLHNLPPLFLKTSSWTLAIYRKLVCVELEWVCRYWNPAFTEYRLHQELARCALVAAAVTSISLLFFWICYHSSRYAVAPRKLRKSVCALAFSISFHRICTTTHQKPLSLIVERIVQL